MGAGCKINHHSFVGNATLGEDVVIGAGSITCNHDGKDVNPTVIEDHAYVGSGVMLIAPVRIGRSAVVAAGSTITRDVPADTLAICRTKDVVLKPRPSS
jgi:bifunctional UDP-N-acetylglucosamine pyrophosphorylase/glucosamine-1-phosphate N-acetyltransferase